MEPKQVYGVYGEGRILCRHCAEGVYGASLEKSVRGGDLQILREEDRRTYGSRGLACDTCCHWIFPPDEANWWEEEPAAAEQLRLLEPFACYLEPLGVDVANLREAVAVGPC